MTIAVHFVRTSVHSTVLIIAVGGVVANSMDVVAVAIKLSQLCVGSAIAHAMRIAIMAAVQTVVVTIMAGAQCMNRRDVAIAPTSMLLTVRIIPVQGVVVKSMGGMAAVQGITDAAKVLRLCVVA